MIARLFVLLVAALALPACGSSSGDGGGEPDAAVPNAAANVVISPAGVLLTADRPSHHLLATALDATGIATDVPVTWTSSDPGAVTVDADGVVTMARPLGSALITATAGGVATTVFAIVAEPVAGAVVIGDDGIVGLPTAVDEAARFGVGFQVVVELTGTPPAVGAILLTNGEKSVAGRVVAVEGTSATLELVPIDEVFAGLDIEQTFHLEDGPGELAGPAALEATVGPFKCEAEGSLGGISLAKTDFDVVQLETLALDVIWNSTQRKLVLSGQPKVTFELEPTLAAALSGKVTCKAIVRDYVIPVPGPLGLFLGAAVPIGVGVELGGTIPVAGVGVNLKGEATADLSVGFDCGAECATIRDVTTTGSLTPTFVGPALSLKVEPEAQVYVWATFEGGGRFSTSLRIAGIDAQAGLKLAGSFATEETQAAEEGYSAGYHLTFEASAGPGEAIDDFLGMIGVITSFLKVETSVDIGRSPIGTLTRDVESFAAGDTVTFTLAVAPTTASLPVLGYNIASVRVYRQSLRDDGSTSLVLANEVVATADQTQFVLPWVATIDGTADTTFVAFVQPVYFDFVRLEQEPTIVPHVAVAGSVTFAQTFSCPTGPFTDSNTTNGEVTAAIDATGVVTSISGTYRQDAAYVSPCDGSYSSTWTMVGTYVAVSGASVARVVYDTETTGRLIVPFECQITAGVGCGVPPYPTAAPALCSEAAFSFTIAPDGSYVFAYFVAPAMCVYSYDIAGTFSPT